MVATASLWIAECQTWTAWRPFSPSGDCLLLLGIIPIISVTAHHIQGDRELCRDTGTNEHLSKPILLEEPAGARDRRGVTPGDPAVDLQSLGAD
ncbi:MAG TPA: hypothetical protein VGK29_03830 [Paludibaculum sp.]|jgi:CheY-like chemotaxis protein